MHNCNNDNSTSDYYKLLYEKHLEESSRLAEQLICLRSDLDKSSIEKLKKSSQYKEANKSRIIASEKQKKQVRLTQNYQNASQILPLNDDEIGRKRVNSFKL